MGTIEPHTGKRRRRRKRHVRSNEEWPCRFRFCCATFCERAMRGIQPFFAQEDIIIRNRLANKLPLDVVCKDKHRRMRAVLKTDETFSFHFRQSIWENELYFCRFYWAGTNKWFDIFESGSPSTGLCDTCDWNIEETGLCLKQKRGSKCFYYNK